MLLNTLKGLHSRSWGAALLYIHCTPESSPPDAAAYNAAGLTV
jgi:hypothetical protein